MDVHVHWLRASSRRTRPRRSCSRRCAAWATCSAARPDVAPSERDERAGPSGLPDDVAATTSSRWGVHEAPDPRPPARGDREPPARPDADRARAGRACSRSSSSCSDARAVPGDRHVHRATRRSPVMLAMPPDGRIVVLRRLRSEYTSVARALLGRGASVADRVDLRIGAGDATTLDALRRRGRGPAPSTSRSSTPDKCGISRLLRTLRRASVRRAALHRARQRRCESGERARTRRSTDRDHADRCARCDEHDRRRSRASTT